MLRRAVIWGAVNIALGVLLAAITRFSFPPMIRRLNAVSDEYAESAGYALGTGDGDALGQALATGGAMATKVNTGGWRLFQMVVTAAEVVFYGSFLVAVLYVARAF